MSQFINYTLVIQNNGAIVPKIGDKKSEGGQFNEQFLEDINHELKSIDTKKSREDFEFLGKKLFNALINPVKGSFQDGLWIPNIRDSEETNVRIRIVFEELSKSTELASQIINLPWEFLCYPNDNNTFLGTHPRVALSYGYDTWLNNPMEGYTFRGSSLHVLFVHGHPSKMADVGFDKYVQTVLTELGESVQVKELKNPTPDELARALKNDTPHILHFLGHGKPGALALGDQANREVSWLEDKSLSDFLRAGGVKLVVLQACKGASASEELAFTGTAAQLVKTRIPAVIAIRYPISQSLALNFVRILYKKLAAGDPVDVAVQAGREKLAIGEGEQSHASRDFGVPVLWMRLRDGLLFTADEQGTVLSSVSNKLPRIYRDNDICRAATFYGRDNKLQDLKNWMLDDRCRLIAVYGPEGIGKTSLVLELVEQIKDQFDCVIIRSLKSSPPIENTLNDLIQCLSDEKQDIFQDTDVDEKINQLINHLGKQRCLLVLDHAQKILRPEVQKDYEKLFRQIGARLNDNSCLIITTQQEPKTIIELKAKNSPVRSLLLNRLNFEDAKKVLKSKGLDISNEEVIKDIIDYYGGNTFALHQIPDIIKSAFDNNNILFLNSLREKGTNIISIRNLLEDQFESLSSLEKQVMFWVAAGSYSKYTEPFKGLKDDIIDSPDNVLDAINSLTRKCLIDNYAQIPVVEDYMISLLTNSIHEEIRTNKLDYLKKIALVKAQGDDYIRENQVRTIIYPIIEKLKKNKTDFKKQLLKILSELRTEPTNDQGYAGGNIINLLTYLKIQDREQPGFPVILNGDLDLSSLSCWQSYFKDVQLHNVKLRNSDLERSVFRDIFDSAVSLAFSPDGKFLVTGDYSGEVCFWDLKKAQKSHSYHLHSSTVWALAFNLDGSKLASCSADKTISLLNITFRNEELVVLTDKKWIAHDEFVAAIAFSTNPEMPGILASASGDKTIKLWDSNNLADNPQARAILREHNESIHALCFSPDGLLLASGSQDKTLRLWDVQNLDNVQEICSPLKGHESIVLSVAFRHDGKVLASGSGDKTVRIWDVSDVNAIGSICTLAEHTREVSSVIFIPNTNLLASSSHDKTINLWDTQNPRQPKHLKTLPAHPDSINRLAFSSDKPLRVASASDKIIKIWDIDRLLQFQCLKTFQGYSCRINSVAFIPSSEILVSAGKDDFVRFWNISSSEKWEILLDFPASTTEIVSIAFNSIGKSLYLAVGSIDGTVKVWDVTNLEEYKELPTDKIKHDSLVCSMAFSPNGKFLATCGSERTVKLWNIQDIKFPKCFSTLSWDGNWIGSVAFNATSDILASSGQDRKITLWEIRPDEVSYKTTKIRDFTGHDNDIQALVFSPDGKRLISGSADKTVRVWDLSSEEGKEGKVLGDHPDPVTSIVIHPLNSEIVASASLDGTVKLWNLQTKECIKPFEKFAHRIFSLSFSANGKFLASGGEEVVICICESLVSGNVNGVTQIRDVVMKERQTLEIPKPYEGLDISGAKGLSKEQKQTLLALGAVEVINRMPENSPETAFQQGFDERMSSSTKSCSYQESQETFQALSKGRNTNFQISSIEVFISYSRKDDKLRKELITHLALLKREKKITDWSDRAIEAGEEWETLIKSKLESARIILLLVSPPFMASDYCYDIEMKRAIARHDAGTARVIPIILRPVDWKGSPFSKLKILPTDGKPVTKWSNKDSAFVDVVQGIRQVVDSLLKDPTVAGGPTGNGFFKFDVTTIDAQGQEISRSRSQAEYFTENLVNDVSLDMVLIPSGTFMMGSPQGEGEEDEHPQHEVTISSFFIGKYPITQKQWTAVVSFPKVELDLNPNPSHFKGDNRPVEKISWLEAVEFCKRLSITTGRDYRLPSESEWEYTCRAKTTTPFHYGEALTGELANYYCATEIYADEPKGNFRGETTLVGSYPPNAFGLYDMHGNVREWCADHRHNSYLKHPNDGSPWLSNNENCARIARGGSWVNLSGYCRSALRSSNDPEHRDFNLGFRVVCSTIT